MIEHSQSAIATSNIASEMSQDRVLAAQERAAALARGETPPDDEAAERDADKAMLALYATRARA
jgi:hypothetical protein